MAIAVETDRDMGADAAERAALRAFVRAVRSSRGYREHLAGLGVHAERVRRLSDVPYLDKRTVFSGPIAPWLEGGRIDGAAELLTSSGQSGHFSVGVTSRWERRGLERTADEALRALGAGEHTSTLLLNCLPMGIAVPTRLATVATPSVHLEMALEMLRTLAPDFDRTVVLAEPVFLKELAETGVRADGPGFGRHVTACFVGGEWVSESWRRHVSSLFGFEGEGRRARAGVLISMGAAELGLHALFETPALREARRALDGAEARRALFGDDPGYTPTLLRWEPTRLHLEERRHDDGTRTVVCTTLVRRLLPLVRYDLDDLGHIVPAEILNRELEWRGSPVRVDGPVLALWGRRGAEARGDGWSVRPERIKCGLFATAAHAARLTGRFHVAPGADGEPVLHAQLRDDAAGDAALAQSLGALVSAAAGAAGRAELHPLRTYPFHDAGDFQHKPAYARRGA